MLLVEFPYSDLGFVLTPVLDPTHPSVIFRSFELFSSVQVIIEFRHFLYEVVVTDKDLETIVQDISCSSNGSLGSLTPFWYRYLSSGK